MSTLEEMTEAKKKEMIESTITSLLNAPSLAEHNEETLATGYLPIVAILAGSDTWKHPTEENSKEVKITLRIPLEMVEALDRYYALHPEMDFVTAITKFVEWTICDSLRSAAKHVIHHQLKSMLGRKEHGS